MHVFFDAYMSVMAIILIRICWLVSFELLAVKAQALTIQQYLKSYLSNIATYWYLLLCLSSCWSLQVADENVHSVQSTSIGHWGTVCLKYVEKCQLVLFSSCVVLISALMFAFPFAIFYF